MTASGKPPRSAHNPRHIIVIEHEAANAADNGLKHLAIRDVAVRLVRPYLGEKLPMLDERIAGVIIKGGPQFVTDLDRFPYLRDEIAFADTVMKRGVPLLGICLGAQMIAHHLGAAVGFHPQGHVALGYYPLEITEAGEHYFPDGLMTLAGNAQGFACPRDATLLAKGPLFANQAFSLGETTVAFQFHPEVDRTILDQWQRELADNVGKPGAQSFEEQDAGFEAHNQRLAEWYGQFLDRFFDLNMAYWRADF
ncbi:glutamine amidotransferase-related protein [Hoeflea prorocentri]|uniref:Glutamine amidotransferase domain-containing protein n=1 Tax=Hoeflea prorocentri TaxID=1922333 RepID=A0A9X3UKM8_9HYPH|nr:hypothetical protein [Hoeflea prorocentri]MCY6382331.1 hypothetical protein [Hoeflea prorocentri]MDA5400131.1 hypothetical protein [Hoeflea prorocentri]